MTLLRSILLLLLGFVSLSAMRADVVTTARPLATEELLALLAREVSTHFNLDGELQLDLVRAWTPPARVAATWSLDVQEFPAFASSSMLLRCRVLAEGEPVADTTFVLRASLWREAWAARQPLVAGTVFDSAMLEARRVDLLRVRDALPSAVGDESFIFARGVSAGRLLTWHDLARRPLVRKGDVIEVSAIEGGLIVTMKALALENGARGDRVMVRNPDSRRDFTATVVNENRVEVRF